MDMKKLNPWNWFKHEEQQREKKETIPVKREDTLQFQPLANMMQLHREIDRLFDDAFRGFPALGRSPLWGGSLATNEFMPAFRASVNIASDERAYTVTLEAPGMERKDISIEFSDRTLVIKGNKQQEKEDTDKHYYRIERHYGSFERVLSVPDDADTDEINASMKNGVLRITIPRKEVAKSAVKKIDIQG